MCKLRLLFKLGTFAILLACFLSSCSSPSSDSSSDQREQAKLMERCQQLQKDIEDLKGRPIRRSAAREYYMNECTNQN